MYSRRKMLRRSLSLAATAYVSTRLSGCALGTDTAALSAVEFSHGVASGDPEDDAVLLWTRAVPELNAANAEIGWEVASDPQFDRVLRSGRSSTSASRDFTVKVDVRELTPGSTFYYRFVGVNGSSPIGRARTLPSGELEELRLAVFSCSNYPAGYFHAYANAAKRADIDAFVHLGDYYYEYGSGGYATERAGQLGRELSPDNSGELYTLEDYRRRYALYRSDTDLQALHAAAPMLAVWDDHEIANDTWREGAQNHTADEGDFGARRAAAVQAYFEWMPLRPIVPDSEGRIYRSFTFGDLVDLHMLDTRLTGRDKQLTYGEFFDDESGMIDAPAFAQALGAPDRSLLGDEQRTWLYGALEASEARWQVLGQQVLMARMTLPAPMLSQLFAGNGLEATAPLMEELLADKAGLAAGEALSEERRRRLATVLPYNLDAWDGYPAERERLYAVAGRLEKELIVLAGDTHNAWYSELRDGGGRRVGAELATSSVSSPGMESYLSLDDSSARMLERAMVGLIDELRYCDLKRRGYLEVSFRHSGCSARWHFLDSVTERRVSVESKELQIRA